MCISFATRGVALGDPPGDVFGELERKTFDPFGPSNLPASTRPRMLLALYSLYLFLGDYFMLDVAVVFTMICFWLFFFSDFFTFPKKNETLGVVYGYGVVPMVYLSIRTVTLITSVCYAPSQSFPKRPHLEFTETLFLLHII